MQHHSDISKFPDAIRNKKEMIIGRRYKKHYTGIFKHSVIFSVISEPYMKPVGEFIKVKIEEYKNLEDEFSLADMGVIPYDDGRWNQVNYVVLDDRRDLFDNV
jgi:hypothetical protein